VLQTHRQQQKLQRLQRRLAKSGSSQQQMQTAVTQTQTTASRGLGPDYQNQNKNQDINHHSHNHHGDIASTGRYDDNDDDDDGTNQDAFVQLPNSHHGFGYLATPRYVQ
jgi:hypothetical protein